MENKTPKYAVVSSAPDDDFVTFMSELAARKEETPEMAAVAVLLPLDPDSPVRMLYHNTKWQDIGTAAQYLNLCFLRSGLANVTGGGLDARDTDDDEEETTDAED